MFDRGEGQQKGPIRRYRKSGRDRKGASKGSASPQVDLNAGEPTSSVTSGGRPITGAPLSSPTSSPRVVRGRRRSYRGAGLRSVLVLAIFLAVIAGAAIPVLTSSTVHSGSPAVVGANAPAPTTTTASQQPSSPASPPAASYLTVAGLRAGLAKIQSLARGATKVALIRIAADSLSASAALRNGTAKEVILAPTGTITETGPATGERAIPFSAIKPTVVVRILAGMRTKFHIPSSKIDYIVLSTPPMVTTQWIVFTKDPAHTGYTATLSGTKLARLPG